MRPSVELDRDRSVSQRPRIVVRRIRTHHDRLAHHRGTEGNDLCSLLALIGPPDLSFLSSPVDGYPRFLEGHVA